MEILRAERGNPHEMNSLKAFSLYVVLSLMIAEAQAQFDTQPTPEAEQAQAARKKQKKEKAKSDKMTKSVSPNEMTPKVGSGKEKGKKSASKKGKYNVKDIDAPLLEQTLNEHGVQLGEAQTHTWQVGVELLAVSTPTLEAIGCFAVPTDWPEQTVKVVKEDITPNVDVQYRNLEGGVRQMIVSTNEIVPLNGTAKAILTFEITKHAILPPKDTSIFRIPKKDAKLLKRYLAPGPLIESKNAKIKNLAKEVAEEKSAAWEKVEALYDEVHSRIRAEGGEQFGAAKALAEGYGSRDDVTALFVALCRAVNVPARMVFVPDDTYAEFYLEDQGGVGYWFPAHVVKSEKEFGFVTSKAPILQRGDNIAVPEKKDIQRFVSEHLDAKGMSPPKVIFTRQAVRDIRQ